MYHECHAYHTVTHTHTPFGTSHITGLYVNLRIPRRINVYVFHFALVCWKLARAIIVSAPPFSLILLMCQSSDAIAKHIFVSCL